MLFSLPARTAPPFPQHTAFEVHLAVKTPGVTMALAHLLALIQRKPKLLALAPFLQR